MWRHLAFCAVMVSMAMAKNVDWEAYKEKYDLVFEDHEETARLAAFEANVKMIKDHNSDADLGKHSYWLGVNQFTHMTNEEYRAKVIGNCLLERNTTKWTADTVFEYDPNLTDEPDSIDWRDLGYVTPVKNQEQCGSCWAFSAVGSMEGAHMKKTGQLVSLSEQQLMDCSKSYGNNGCQGGLMVNATNYVIEEGGIDTEDSYPYAGRVHSSCKYEDDNKGATITKITEVHKSENGLKTAVATIGPISVAIDASQKSFQLYSDGVYHSQFCSSTRLDHGVLVVGYGTFEGKDYWLVKNSWGAEWGMKGYIMMSRNRNNNCGIATMASYATA